MNDQIILLMTKALTVYLLVLGAHSLRQRFGPVHFYALLGGITAIMSWVTDAGLAVQAVGITFVVGSTVFYTALLLGVFVVYVFEGPKETRIAISTVVGISILMPLTAAALHLQMNLAGDATAIQVPMPSLRINAASVVTTVLDLFFLAVAWEFLGRRSLRLGLWFRTWLTLLGVMWLDVVLFTSGAFAGTPAYWSIMQGTLISRLVLSLFALPFLYSYLYWQSRVKGLPLENRPVLAILKRVDEIKAELSRAQQEIEQRMAAERALQKRQALLQEQLLRKEKLAVLGQLAGGLGHELRNPLGTIKSAAYLIEHASSDLPPAAQEGIAIVNHQVDQCDRIIHSLLDFARERTPHRQPVDLNEIARQALSLVDLPHDVELCTACDPHLPPLQADPDQLLQVLRNVIDNAVQAMPEGGVLSIETAAVPAKNPAASGGAFSQERPASRGKGPCITVSVSDTGIGIPPEVMEHIFEPLYTTKPRGIGLGLALTKSLIEGHGGTIGVESAGVPGQGSTFTITLPV